MPSPLLSLLPTTLVAIPIALDALTLALALALFVDIGSVDLFRVHHIAVSVFS